MPYTGELPKNDFGNATPNPDTAPAWQNQVANMLRAIDTVLGNAPQGVTATIDARVGTIELHRSGRSKGFINHGSNANATRFTGFASVEWFGSVAPNNALDGDTWIDTSV